MRPDEEGMEDLEAQLRAELDALPLAAPLAMQARYRQASATAARRGALRRLGPLAAGAAAVFLLAFAVGGLNPSTWRTQSAGAMQRIRLAIGVPVAVSSPSPRPSPSTSPSPAGERTGTPVAPESSPEPAEHETTPEPAASPSSDGGGGTSGGTDGGTSGGTGDGGAEASPSPSPSSDH